MNELIAYFQKIEDRLSALENALQALTDQVAEQLTTTSALTRKIVSLQNDLTSLQEQLATYQEANAELESRMDELESRSEFALPNMDDDEYDDEPAADNEVEVTIPDLDLPDLDELSADEEESLPIIEDEPEPQPAPAPAPAPTSIVPKVNDIKKAISLGDRFLFQRELFGGNGELMAKTIAELNGMHSMDEADAYIRKHFDWDKESNACELFYNILKRRW